MDIAADAVLAPHHQSHARATPLLRRPPLRRVAIPRPTDALVCAAVFAHCARDASRACRPPRHGYLRVDRAKDAAGVVHKYRCGEEQRSRLHARTRAGASTRAACLSRRAVPQCRLRPPRGGACATAEAAEHSGPVLCTSRWAMGVGALLSFAIVGFQGWLAAAKVASGEVRPLVPGCLPGLLRRGRCGRCCARRVLRLPTLVHVHTSATPPPARGSLAPARSN